MRNFCKKISELLMRKMQNIADFAAAQEFGVVPTVMGITAV